MIFRSRFVADSGGAKQLKSLWVQECKSEGKWRMVRWRLISLKNTSNWWFKKHGGGPFIFASVLLQCWLISFSSSQLYITGKNNLKSVRWRFVKDFSITFDFGRLLYERVLWIEKSFEATSTEIDKCKWFLLWNWFQMVHQFIKAPDLMSIHDKQLFWYQVCVRERVAEEINESPLFLSEREWREHQGWNTEWLCSFFHGLTRKLLLKNHYTSHFLKLELLKWCLS